MANGDVATIKLEQRVNTNNEKGGAAISRAQVAEEQLLNVVKVGFVYTINFALYFVDVAGEYAGGQFKADVLGQGKSELCV